MKRLPSLKISKSDYYRNELDIEYNPGLALRLGANMNLAQYIPYQIRDRFVSMLSLFGPRGAASRRREFPMDNLADELDPATSEKRDFWQKEFGVIMTHDVDTKRGYEYGMRKFVEIEREMDIISTFNIVPESLEYDFESEYIRELHRDGFDFGMHGLHHDGKFVYLSLEEQKRRVERAAKIAESLEVPIGYRAPYLHRTKYLVKHLTDSGYLWDSSFPDTDESTVGFADTGSRTLFPFYPIFRDKNEWNQSPLVEIPVSMPQDWTLLYYYKLSENKMLKVWKQKMDYIKSKNGLAVFIIHPDPEDLGHPKRLKFYRKVLEMIKREDPEWYTCTSLANRWKERFQTHS